MQMKEKIEKWINSESEHIENQVLGIDGGFGTGKTTYIKNIDKILDWEKIDKKIIYINLLNLDLDDNFINNLIKIFNKSKDVVSSAKEKTTDLFNQLKNKIKGKLWLEIDAFDDVKTIQKRTSKYENSKKRFFNNCVFILDDIERINPQNILKTLGLINQLSYKYEKMKILVPYNSKALNDVLNNFFGIQNIENKENYLQKYLGNSIDFEVDYVEIARFIMKIADKDFGLIIDIIYFLEYLKIININWRNIILLREHIKNIPGLYTFEFFIKTNGLSLFDKKTFENNILTFKNKKFLLLKNDKKCYFDFQKKYSSAEYIQLNNKLNWEKPWPNDVEKPSAFESSDEIIVKTIIDEEIYNFFKKYHNS